MKYANSQARSWRICGVRHVSSVVAVFASVATSRAQITNGVALSLPLTPLPEAGPSLLRVLGALALVLALFLAGVWLFRNWQRVIGQRGRSPRLTILETRSLGGRQAIHVVGYDQERFLLAATPSGVNLLTHLPSSVEEAESVLKETPVLKTPFQQALAQVLGRK